ncbi:type II CAAX prenyl endopeptidase Rce1 family protein [Thermobrachium celere]|uniref:CAAX amino terminal protease family n=1 Tax=Thermobrachium celere DSM 8682 TaxID=941824 RepID=R7RU53_9CLOT|nr:CPBP family glutamic-type intramembrane protease [Thermobrachium celere]CDF58946.1 CAAX amino terminal protease family [Thermobrachium celere DSM 8682]
MNRIYVTLRIILFLILSALGLYISEAALNYLSIYFKNEYLFNVIHSLISVLIVLFNIRIFVKGNLLEFINLDIKKINYKKLINILLFTFIVNIFITIVLLGIKKYYVYNYIWDKLYIEDIVAVILTGLIISLSFAFIEEIILRGFILNTLPFKKKTSVLIVALVYVVFNVLSRGFNLIFMLNLFLYSMFLNLIYIKYNNLIYTLAANFIWFFTSNFIFSLSFEPDKLDFLSVINLIYGNYDIISGGEYGIFGSIIFLIVMSLADIYVLKWMGVFNRRTLEG